MTFAARREHNGTEEARQAGKDVPASGASADDAGPFWCVYQGIQVIRVAIEFGPPHAADPRARAGQDEKLHRPGIADAICSAPDQRQFVVVGVRSRLFRRRPLDVVEGEVSIGPRSIAQEHLRAVQTPGHHRRAAIVFRRIEQRSDIAPMMLISRLPQRGECRARLFSWSHMTDGYSTCRSMKCLR